MMPPLTDPVTDPRLEAQRGSALVAVMIVMVLLMSLGTMLVNVAVVNDAEAVDQSLAETRAYWAAMGHVTYVRSRFGEMGCAAPCDTNKPDRASNYLDELTNTDSERQRLWEYVDEYGFRILGEASADEAEARLALSLPEENATQGADGAGALRALRTRFGKLLAGLTVTDGAPDADPDPGGVTTIEFLRREAL